MCISRKCDRKPVKTDTIADWFFRKSFMEQVGLALGSEGDGGSRNGRKDPGGGFLWTEAE